MASGQGREDGASGPMRSRSPAGVGRSAGSGARHRVASARTRAGTPDRSGAARTTLFIVSSVEAPENGPVPVQANTSTEPSENTSEAAVSGCDRVCSGDMNPGVPMSAPVRVRSEPSAARAMPKSMTRGPLDSRITLPGLRSRWITPAAWIDASAEASPAASRIAAASGSGPAAFTASSRVGPRRYSDASHGTGASGPAPTTAAV
nr:hypothetical protein GCM10025732_28500 [Glycomyces mayteni]